MGQRSDAQPLDYPRQSSPPRSETDIWGPRLRRRLVPTGLTFQTPRSFLPVADRVGLKNPRSDGGPRVDPTQAR